MEQDWTNTGGDRNAGWYGGGQERPADTSSLVFKFSLLSSTFHYFFSSCLFPTEYNDRRGRVGRDQRGRDDVLFAPTLRGPGGKGTGWFTHN